MTDVTTPEGGGFGRRAVPASDFLYRAACEKCGHVARESTNRSLTSTPLFLPAHCRKCGASKDCYATFMWRSGWVHEFGRYVYPSRFLTRPSTWFARPVWLEHDDTRTASDAETRAHTTQRGTEDE